ncbi:MAG TPA: hypothetical protein VGB45_06165 [Abditibacterium sp.]|jgi:hypothetical protein
MAKNQTPAWQFAAYPLDAISNRRVDAFVVADLMADVLDGSPSAFGGIYLSGAVAGQWNDWTRLGNDLSVKNVGFARFLKNGEVVSAPKPGQTGGGGFYALPFHTPVQNTIQGNNDSGNTIGTWKAESGTWKGVPAFGGKGRGIYNEGGELTQVASTVGDLAQGQQLQLDLSFLDQTRSGPRKEFYLDLGKNLRLAGRQGMPIALEQLQTKTETVGGERTLKEQWGMLKTMDALGEFDTRDSHYTVTVSRLGDRLIWDVNGHRIWLLDADDESKPRAIEWGGAPMKATCVNLRARIGTSRITNLPGTVTRTIKRPISNQILLSTPRAGGHLPIGSSIPVTIADNGDSFSYTATLTPDTATGLSPLFTQMALVYAPTWVSFPASGVNITKAVSRASITLAHPPVQAGAEGNFEIDVRLLQTIPGGLAACKDFCPIEVSGRWRDDKGDPIGDYKGLMRGHLFGTQGDLSDYNADKKTFTMRDPIVRLREPAGVVKGDAHPLEWAFYERLENLSSQKDENSVSLWNNGRKLTRREKQFFDGDAVKGILNQFLGPLVAATLNGNGDGNRFLPPEHPPLLDYADAMGAWLPLAGALGANLTAGSLQAQEGAIFPPNYKQDALSWINKFCADMFTTFLFGHVNRDTDPWPVPIYGRYEEFLAKAVLWSVGADVMQKIATQTKPESDINEWWIISKPFGAGNIPLVPGFVQGMARVARGPNAPQSSWARTKVLETNLATGAASAAVAAAIALSEGDSSTRMQWPTIGFRGTAGPQPGDVFTTDQGEKIDVAGVWFRAATITHDYLSTANEPRKWDTTVALQTMSRTQKVAFARRNFLPISTQ